MAKLKGILPIEGTVGNITFQKAATGEIIVKEKSGISAERMANDPAFERTRESNREFGRAGKASSLIHKALRSNLRGVADSRMFSRLLKRMMEVVHADGTSARGSRNVMDGDLNLLTGFEFNRHAQLGNVFSASYTTSIDRPTGVLKVTVPPFVPSAEVSVPDGATHFKLRAAGIAADFIADTKIVATDESTLMPVNSLATSAVTLDCTLPEALTQPLLLSFGICYYQQLNGNYYPLNNDQFNATAIVQVAL